MNAGAAKSALVIRCAGREHGLSLVEMLVAILIALFLLAGIVVVEQGVQMSYSQQNGLSQLQDQERFAMSVLASVIGTAGYYPNPQSNSQVTALPAAGSFIAGQAIYAPNSSPTVPFDSVYVRYMTAAGDGINLCDGSAATNNVYTSWLYVATDANGNNDLYCVLETGSTWGTAIPLVTGLYNMQIVYGVATGADNNVTEYLNAQEVTAGSYWPDVTSAQVTLTFNNPLWGQPGQQQYVTFTRVISVMGRVGETG
jgi:type IV pilus assembly protein PilW